MGSNRNGSTPAERLIQTAAELFAREGIRAVGVDRLIAEAQVARASLYQSFGSKDALITAYLDRQHETDRAVYERATARIDDPVERVLVLFDLAETASRRSRYRGCPFLNATTEFPDHHHPVSKVVLKRRQWLLDRLLAALRNAGVDDPRALAEQLQLLYDGGLAGSKVNRSGEPIRLAKQMAEELIVGSRARARTDSPHA
jgi:AcrR family transcriptional regulator